MVDKSLYLVHISSLKQSLHLSFCFLIHFLSPCQFFKKKSNNLIDVNLSVKRFGILFIRWSTVLRNLDNIQQRFDELLIIMTSPSKEMKKLKMKVINNQIEIYSINFLLFHILTV